MSFVLTAFSVALGLCFVHLSAQWIALRCTGTSVHTVLVFYGTPIASFPLLGTTCVIGCIPTGGSLAFDLVQFGRLPLLGRLAILLVGPAALLALAAALLRYDLAFHHFATGFSQFISGALRPRTVAVELLTRLHAVFASSFLALVGVLAAKISAATLLPFGGGTGGRCIRELFIRYSKRSWFTATEVVTVLLMFAALAAWAFASCMYVFHTSTGNA